MFKSVLTSILLLKFEFFMQVVYVVRIVAEYESWCNTLNLFCLSETFFHRPFDWALVSQCWHFANKCFSRLSFILAAWKFYIWLRAVVFFSRDSVEDAVTWAVVAVVHNLNTRSKALHQIFVLHCLRSLVLGFIVEHHWQTLHIRALFLTTSVVLIVVDVIQDESWSS